MSKIQSAIRDSIEGDEIIILRVTPAERAELIDAADDYDELSGVIDAWKADPTNRGFIWRPESTESLRWRGPC